MKHKLAKPILIMVMTFIVLACGQGTGLNTFSYAPQHKKFQWGFGEIILRNRTMGLLLERRSGTNLGTGLNTVAGQSLGSGKFVNPSLGHAYEMQRPRDKFTSERPRNLRPLARVEKQAVNIIVISKLKPGQKITLGGKEYRVLRRHFDHGIGLTKAVEEIETGKRFILKRREGRQREEKALASLNQPCHARIYAVYEKEDAYLMPDYGEIIFYQHVYSSAVHRPPFKEWLERRVSEIMWLYEAINEMHINGMAHADLKPVHILYSDGIPHITDYHWTSFDRDSEDQMQDIRDVARGAEAIVDVARYNYGRNTSIKNLELLLQRIALGTVSEKSAITASKVIDALLQYLQNEGCKRIDIKSALMSGESTLDRLVTQELSLVHTAPASSILRPLAEGEGRPAVFSGTDRDISKIGINGMAAVTEGRKRECSRKLFVWLEGNDAVSAVKGDNKVVEKIPLANKVKISSQVGGKSNCSMKGIITDFDRQSVNIEWDEAAVPYHSVTELSFGVIDTQGIGEFSKKYRYAGAAVNIGLCLQGATWTGDLDLNDRIKLFLIFLEWEFDYLLHRRWLNSSAPGTGKNKGMDLGYFLRAAFRAPSPVNISPRHMIMDWRGYFLTNFSKFIFTNVSLSRISAAISSLSLHPHDAKNSISFDRSQGDCHLRHSILRPLAEGEGRPRGRRAIISTKPVFIPRQRVSDMYSELAINMIERKYVEDLLPVLETYKAEVYSLLQILNRQDIDEGLVRRLLEITSVLYKRLREFYDKCTTTKPMQVAEVFVLDALSLDMNAIQVRLQLILRYREAEHIDAVKEAWEDFYRKADIMRRLLNEGMFPKGWQDVIMFDEHNRLRLKSNDSRSVLESI